MSIHILPLVPSDPHYQIETTIEDVPYLFEVRWNERDASWYLSAFDIEGAAIFQGERIVLNAYIGRKATHPLLQAGVFVPIDRSETLTDAGFDDLGVRVELRYYPYVDLIREAVSP